MPTFGNKPREERVLSDVPARALWPPTACAQGEGTHHCDTDIVNPHGNSVSLLICHSLHVECGASCPQGAGTGVRCPHTPP